MSRLISFLAFFSVAMGVVFFAHYYLWVRFVRDTHLPSPWRQIVTGVILAMGISGPLFMILVRGVDARWVKSIAWPIFLWMGIWFIFATLLGGVDFFRFVALKLNIWPEFDAEKRVFFARVLGGGAALVGGLLGANAVWTAITVPPVKKVSVKLKRLPSKLSGLRIVQISDLHVSSTVGAPYVEGVVAKTNALNPDIVVLTGDIVDGTVNRLREGAAPLGNLTAKYGVYMVTGNHEYYSGADPWIAEFTRLGIRVLRNERVSIGDGEDSFDLAGVDDRSAHRFGGDHGADLAKAVAGRDISRELVLLAHQPREIDNAVKHGVGLMLSGHTHGGQIFPFGLMVLLAQPFLAGLGRRGDTQVYVSRGTGYWGPPMRLGAPSELTEIELRSA